MGYSQVTRWCHTLLIELDNFSISSNPQVTILSIASFCRYWAIPSIIRDLLYKRCSSIIRGYNRISSDLGSIGYRSPGPPVVTAVYGVIRKRCQLAACAAADAAGSNCCLHPISYSAGSEKPSAFELFRREFGQSTKHSPTSQNLYICFPLYKLLSINI